MAGPEERGGDAVRAIELLVGIRRAVQRRMDAEEFGAVRWGTAEISAAEAVEALAPVVESGVGAVNVGGEIGDLRAAAEEAAVALERVAEEEGEMEAIAACLEASVHVNRLQRALL